MTFLQVLTSSLATFSFSRLRWPRRDKVFLLYLSTMMLPGLVMMIPNYQIMITLGLVDTLAGLVLLMAAVTMAVIPMIIVFVCLQKYLVRGLQVGGVKG